MAKGTGLEFRVLVVDDEHLYAQAIGHELKRKKVEVDLAYNAAEAIKYTLIRKYQVILLDHKLPDDDGIRIIPLLLSRQPGASLIMMTAFETIPNAIQAIRQGAEDYHVKQPSVKPLVQRVMEVCNREQVREKVKGWEERPQGLLGDSTPIREARERFRKVALSSETTVLITGETGVGKEVAARYLHHQTSPQTRPFVTVDCLSLPGNLVESLLFGHEKGAFTGAEDTREGAFHEAGKGTIFLDEIGEMEVSLQGKLLRVLETRLFQRLGSVRQLEVGARVVAATNRDLLQLVREGRFRFDLYQRLAVFPIEMPPLRRRRDDVTILAEHFLSLLCAKLNNPHARLSEEVREALNSYDYPGNVRELRNIIEGAVIMAEGQPVSPRHLPERVLSQRNGARLGDHRSLDMPVDFIAGVDTLETFEKKMIIQALLQTKGVKTEAAELLGISRYQLLRRIDKYHLSILDLNGKS